MTGDRQPGRHDGGIDTAALAAAVEASPMPMVLTDALHPDGPVVWANEAFAALTGYARDELRGRGWRTFLGPDTDPDVVRSLEEAVAAGRSIFRELLYYRKDGTPFWNGVTVTPVRDASGRAIHVFAAQADVTEKRRLEASLAQANRALEQQVRERTAALEAALKQKTALLQEVDHRVKNVLQVILSLTLLKARRSPDGPAREVLQAMAERVGALSTAHRMLGMSEDFSRFDMQEFAAELLDDLTAGLDGERIAVTSEIAPIACPAAMAAPLALLTHELVANALLHAFPEGRSGKVQVVVRSGEDGMLIIVEDDGIGLDASAPNTAGFGRELVEMLARQMRGQVSVADAAPGTRVEVAVPMPEDPAP